MASIVGKSIAHGLAAAMTLTLAPLTALPARAADVDVGSIHISQPWSRATPKGASAAAAYMTITNNGKTAGSGELRVGRRQRRVPNSQHDNG